MQNFASFSLADNTTGAAKVYASSVMKSTLLAVVMIVISPLSTCLGAQCGPQMSKWVGGSSASRVNNLMTLHRSGASAIPLLIEQINDSGEIKSVYLANPIISRAYFDNAYYCGIAAAYLIEWLLSIEHPAPLSDGDLFLGRDPSNYPYSLGRLTKENSATQIGKKELPKIRAVYSAWWEANKSKDMSTLRHEWASGKRPLEASIYKWQ